MDPHTFSKKIAVLLRILWAKYQKWLIECYTVLHTDITCGHFIMYMWPFVSTRSMPGSLRVTPTIMCALFSLLIALNSTLFFSAEYTGG